MNCPKCSEPMKVHDDVFWLPRHAPNNNPPISNSGGMRVRAYKCEECGYVLLGEA